MRIKFYTRHVSAAVPEEDTKRVPQMDALIVLLCDNSFYGRDGRIRIQYNFHTYLDSNMEFRFWCTRAKSVLVKFIDLLNPYSALTTSESNNVSIVKIYHHLL